MIPEKVQYTGLEIDPQVIHSPRKIMTGTYPTDWVRYQFESHEWVSTRNIDPYLERILVGRWGSYTVNHDDTNGTTVVIVFELVTDAVMFRLKGGETAWKEDESNW
jgi:hypothetical protein